jgi:hypothetical protein
MGPRIKGASVVQIVKALRRNKQAALRALPAALHPYLERRIHVGLWYSDEEACQLMKALAAALPVAGEDPWVLMGRASVSGHLEGVYKASIQDLLSSADGVLRYADALWKSIHDTGSLRFHPEGETAGTVELAGYTPPLPEVCRLHGAYFEEVMRRTGDPFKELSKRDCVLRGADACRWRWLWDHPQER